MASIRKISTGKWQAQIARKGVRKSASFDTKQQAKDWAAREEYLIKNAAALSRDTPFGDVMRRYAREVSPDKRGEVFEARRIKAFCDMPIAKRRISDLTSTDFAAWRDDRLKEVAPGTVIREMTLLSSIFKVAKNEWRLVDSNPLTDVRRPRQPQARERTVQADELERMMYVAGDDLAIAQARAIHAFRFAMETAMRAGEIVGLTWNAIDLRRRTAHLPKTKTGIPRDVPLSKAAVDLLEALPRHDPVFNLTSRQLDVLFRKVRDKAGVKGLTFHDSRHHAITRLARRLEVLDLARMVGHKDINQLLTYYNPDASEIARRLD